jgi:arginine decarboxylase-like protein
VQPPPPTVPQQAFAAAIERFEYKGRYNGVFPVKCNHDKDLIRAIVRHGAPYGFGLEVRGLGCLDGGVS